MPPPRGGGERSGGTPPKGSRGGEVKFHFLWIPAKPFYGQI